MVDAIRRDVEASARLIAAAPDLLEAAQRVLELAKRCGDIPDQEWDAAIDGIASAIAKALGHD